MTIERLSGRIDRARRAAGAWLFEGLDLAYNLGNPENLQVPLPTQEQESLTDLAILNANLRGRGLARSVPSHLDGPDYLSWVKPTNEKDQSRWDYFIENLERK